MGLHDAEEMLEVAKADVVQLERDLAKVRAVLARTTDLVGAELDELDGLESLAAAALRSKLVGIRHVLDGAAASEHDLSPLSGLFIDGKRLTWREVAADREDRLRTASEAVVMLRDLNRSRQGRHEGDIEDGAISLGNPHLSTGQTIGYSIHGTYAYVVPEPYLRGFPEAWKRPRP